MCGIAVSVLAPGHCPLEETRAVRAMIDAFLHRGPDGSAVLADEENGVRFGHARLAIGDLSENGLQPMTNETGDVWLVCNGEVYNHAALRPSLEARGHRFRSRSDSEVILHLYEEHGASLIDHLDGKFAFAVWDAGRRILLLARDRLGVKPLYYHSRGERFLFASSPKAILEHPDVGVDLSREGVWHYLTFNCLPAPHTLFAGIRKLPAGCRLLLRPGQEPRVETYWDLPSPVPHAGARGDAEEELRTLLRAAAEKRMMADVPVGAPSLLPNLLLAREARRDGIPVVQVGEGADELFFGYAANRRGLLLQRFFWKHVADLPLGARRAAHRALEGPLRFAGDISPENALDLTLREGFRRSATGERGLFDPQETRRLFDEHRRGSPAAFYPIWTLFILALWHDRWIVGRRGA